MKQHHRLLISLALGGLLGVALHGTTEFPWLPDFNTHFLQPIGQIFLRLIFMIVVPMVFSALVLGVFELGQSRGLGRVAARTLLYTVIASSLSVIVGIGLVNIFRPGDQISFSPEVTEQFAKEVDKIKVNAAAAKPASQALVELITKNPLDSAVRALDGEMLAFMIFALIFGLALSHTTAVPSGGSTEAPNRPVILDILDQIFQATMKIVEYAMKLAPYAVFVIVFNTAFKFGPTIFVSLGFYVGVVILGLLIQQFVVYGALLKFAAKRSPWAFFRDCKEVYLYAFSTASSNATLPRSLALAETTLGLPSKISRFVLTVGATANQNGTALFEGITVLFLAQVYHVDLSVTQQVYVVMMSILAGIGTAGVPGGSLPLIMILLTTVGIPAEGMGIILGVDRLLDMCRTTLNVSGDLVIASVVAAGEPD